MRKDESVLMHEAQGVLTHSKTVCELYPDTPAAVPTGRLAKVPNLTQPVR